MTDEITVTRQPDGTFAVEVRQGAGRSSHRVTVPDGLGPSLGAASLGDEQLVEMSFQFLLEREPASSILGSFGLQVIERYFPEYRREMTRRLSGDA